MTSWGRCSTTIFSVSIYTAEFQFFGNDNILFQFIVTPSNFEKPIKLQLPILLATYPLRNEDGTMRRKTKAEYPTTLPIFRPWLDEKICDNQPQMRTMNRLAASNCSHDLSPPVMSLSPSSSTFL